jgi:anti-sigma B factor antagonist
MAQNTTRSDVRLAPLQLSTLTRHHGEVVVVVRGEVDVGTAPTLLSLLDEAMLHPSCRTLIVDLREVRFLGARGVGVLLTARLAADAHDVRLALVAEHRAVLRPLEITATTDRFAVYPTVAEAGNQARAAATSAPTPIPSVGSTTGANSDEWFEGCSATSALSSASLPAPAKAAGSAPPRIQ